MSIRPSREKSRLWNAWRGDEADTVGEAAHAAARECWRALAEPYEAATDALARTAPTTLAGFIAKAKVAAVEPFIAIHVARELAAFGARASCHDANPRILTA